MIHTNRNSWGVCDLKCRFNDSLPSARNLCKSLPHLCVKELCEMQICFEFCPEVTQHDNGYFLQEGEFPKHLIRMIMNNIKCKLLTYDSNPTTIYRMMHLISCITIQNWVESNGESSNILKISCRLLEVLTLMDICRWLINAWDTPYNLKPPITRTLVHNANNRQPHYRIGFMVLHL